MRFFRILPAALFLSGCIHLGAKPMGFTCGGLLAANTETYQATPLFSELQRDAGFDDCLVDAGGRPNCSGSGSREMITSEDPIEQALDDWRGRNAQSKSPQITSRPAKVPVLMLSGGGSWGAFGAGYLNALDRRDWAVVTGVSTGALQGLFVAAGDYPALANAYGIDEGSELARSNGLRGLLFRGSEYDLAPLRQKIMAYLLPSGDAESPLLRMVRADRPDLSIAMVEARSGDLKVVHITRMLRAALGAEAHPDRAKLHPIAECVAGVALASSSIPVRLTPVQIDGHTYVDGGVRSSVFEAGVARRLNRFSARAASVEPHIYVIRNGPTIVFRDTIEPGKPGVAAVDARPDIMRVGMRGYSTIVNQNELMSIASLRLNYPRGPISVISADGFNAPMNPKPCGPRPEALFEARFMRCLIGWGTYKARSGPSWISLRDLDAARSADAPNVTK
jgi:hypothetical protein